MAYQKDSVFNMIDAALLSGKTELECFSCTVYCLINLTGLGDC